MVAPRVSRCSFEPRAHSFLGLEDVVDIGGIDRARLFEPQSAVLIGAATRQDFKASPAVRDCWIGSKGILTGADIFFFSGNQPSASKVPPAEVLTMRIMVRRIWMGRWTNDHATSILRLGSVSQLSTIAL
jgi:hypothetical protein